MGYSYIIINIIIIIIFVIYVCVPLIHVWSSGRAHAPSPVPGQTVLTSLNQPHLPNHFIILGPGSCVG